MMTRFQKAALLILLLASLVFIVGCDGNVSVGIGYGVGYPGPYYGRGPIIGPGYGGVWIGGPVW